VLRELGVPAVTAIVVILRFIEHGTAVQLTGWGLFLILMFVYALVTSADRRSK
jgi:hypothetical protein